MKEKKPKRFQEVSTEGSALSESGCKTVIVDTQTGVNYMHIKCGYSGSITPFIQCRRFAGSDEIIKISSCKNQIFVV